MSVIMFKKPTCSLINGGVVVDIGVAQRPSGNSITAYTEGGDRSNLERRG